VSEIQSPRQASIEFFLRGVGRYPVVLTLNGKAELVVQGTASYQTLLVRAEQMDALRASIAEMRAGKVIPVEGMLAEMKQVLVEKQGR
jgi:hypothetical protein